LISKMPGDRWQQLAGVRAYLAYMWAHPGKQLLFMGSELGQYAEWSESRGLDWWLLDNADHRGVQKCLADLNRAYRDTPALWSRDNEPAGFEWIDADDSQGNTFSWLRWGHDGAVVASLVNFSGGPHEGYRVGLPFGGTWRELVNTDAEVYGGSGVGNQGAVFAEEIPWHGLPYSALVRVPPLGALWLAPE
jgi:1,4-alpha-glucan branching enzyme